MKPLKVNTLKMTVWYSLISSPVLLILSLQRYVNEIGIMPETTTQEEYMTMVSDGMMSGMPLIVVMFMGFQVTLHVAEAFGYITDSSTKKD